MRITKRAVDAMDAPANGRQAFHWDDRLKGFGVKVTDTGTKTYVVKGRVKGGKEKRITLGRHGVLTPDEARARAVEYLNKFNQGIDPVNEETRSVVLKKTLREFANEYIDPSNRTPDKRLKQTTVDNIRLHINVTFASWADKPLAAITRDKVREHFLQLSNRTPAQANQAYRVLRAIWNEARNSTKQDDGVYLFPENPITDVLKSKNTTWNTVQPRSRKIPTDYGNGRDKVGAVWNMLQELRRDPAQTKIGRGCADLVCFLLLTGARFLEGAALRWDHVDLENKSWKLDADQAKNGQGVTFPLSNLAIQIIQERPRTDSPYVFPGRSGAGHVSDVRGIMAKVSEIANVDKLSAHDLRRTFRSIAGAAGIDFLTTKLLMNHVINDDVTTKHYTETADLTYLQSAVERIGVWVSERAKVAAGENVIPFPPRRAKDAAA
jgi:integrase